MRNDRPLRFAIEPGITEDVLIGRRKPRHEVVRVVLIEGEDPKVYSARTGEDVQRLCRTITISPGREAFAVMLDVGPDDRPFFDPETEDVASYKARVLSIRAEGVWSHGGEETGL